MEIKVFTNSDFGEVRITVNKNKEVLFCLSDVCRALDLTNPSMVKGRLDEAGLSQIEVCSTSVNQYGAKSVRTTNMTYIGEANLYRCIFQSLRLYPPPKIGTLSCHFSECPVLLSIFLQLHGIGLWAVANSGRCLLFWQKVGEKFGGTENSLYICGVIVQRKEYYDDINIKY